MPAAIRWSRVVVEGIVIVTSIVLAFGVQAWWEYRQDRVAEAEYLAAIRDELLLNLSGLEGNTGITETADEALTRADRILEKGQDRDSALVFVSSLLIGAQIGPPRVATSVFDELTSTGRIVVIRDLGLRRAMLEHYARTATTLDRMARSRERYNPRLASVVARHLPYGVLVGRGPRVLDFQFEASDLNDQALKAAAQSLATDPALVDEMQAESAMHVDQVFYLAQYHADLLEALQMLEAWSP